MQLKSLDKAVTDGKLSEDLAEKIRSNLEKIPDFVRFQIVHIEK
jgi:hypothetical protein